MYILSFWLFTEKKALQMNYSVIILPVKKQNIKKLVMNFRIKFKKVYLLLTCYQIDPTRASKG